MSETDTATPERVTLEELKRKTPTELLSYAEGLEIENASSLRTQEWTTWQGPLLQPEVSQTG